MEIRRLVPAEEMRVEMRVANSRFIAYAAPASSVEEARTFIARIQAEHPEASHHVPAFRIGHGASISEHCTDAGEPSGTAGRPALTVLQGSGLGNIVVVVVRYFGGTKLGTGGLVRAYSDAVKAVLLHLPLAEIIPTQTVMLAFQYTYYERLSRLITRFAGQVLDEDFGVEVTVTARLGGLSVNAFREEVQDLTRGTVQIEVVEMNENSAFPVGSFDTGAQPGGQAER